MGDVTDALPEWPLEERPDPEREALQRAMWGIVRTLIKQELTDHQRGVLLAHVFHQKVLDLVAGDPGSSRDAIYKSIHDARRKVRQPFSKVGSPGGGARGPSGVRFDWGRTPSRGVEC